MVSARRFLSLVSLLLLSLLAFVLVVTPNKAEPKSSMDSARNVAQAQSTTQLPTPVPAVLLTPVSYRGIRLEPAPVGVIPAVSWQEAFSRHCAAGCFSRTITPTVELVLYSNDEFRPMDPATLKPKAPYFQGVVAWVFTWRSTCYGDNPFSSAPPVPFACEHATFVGANTGEFLYAYTGPPRT